MNVIIIANILSFIGSIITVFIGYIKSRKSVIRIQTVQSFFFIANNLLLGGISGLTSNTIGVGRNLLEYYNKLTVWTKIILSCLYIISFFVFCDITIINSLPVIASVFYTWLISVKNKKLFKVVIICNILMWCTYDFFILNFASCLFDVAAVISNCIGIYRIYKDEKAAKILKDAL